MRTEGELKLESQIYNENTTRLIEPIEIKNAFYNFHRIYAEMSGGFAKAVAALKTDKREPIINCGSGPSLEDGIPYLKKWKGKIMCGTSQVTTLKYHGIEPDFLVVLDPQTLLEEIAEVDTWQDTKTKFIAHPCVMPDLLEYWQWGKYYYREMSPQREFHWRIMALAYDFIETYMFLFSCSAAAQVGLAGYMGYEPQFLMGMDFSMPDYRSRCPRWYYDREMPRPISLHELANHTAESFPGGWECTPTLPMIPEHVVMSFNGVPTSDMQIFYKRALMSLWRIDRMQLINTYPGNMLYELPIVGFDELIETQGYGHESKYLSDDRIKRLADEYMATRNQFAIEFGNEKRRGAINVRFVENYNPWKELPDYMERLNDRIRINMPDATLEDDLIDIKANMERLESLKAFISAKTLQGISAVINPDMQSEETTPETMIRTEEERKRWQELRDKESARIGPAFKRGLPDIPDMPSSTIKTEEDVEKWKENELRKAKFTGDGSSKENIVIQPEETDDPQDRRRRLEIVTREIDGNTDSGDTG